MKKRLKRKLTKFACLNYKYSKRIKYRNFCIRKLLQRKNDSIEWETKDFIHKLWLVYVDGKKMVMYTRKEKQGLPNILYAPYIHLDNVPTILMGKSLNKDFFYSPLLSTEDCKKGLLRFVYEKDEVLKEIKVTLQQE